MKEDEGLSLETAQETALLAHSAFLLITQEMAKLTISPAIPRALERACFSGELALPGPTMRLGEPFLAMLT
ncbi:MAG TPA: hypothetical protein VKB29_08980 [Candidatus Binataceae bacterium]|nr:hypothetical protein [Candidatus Binataceae bacterium]